MRSSPAPLELRGGPQLRVRCKQGAPVKVHGPTPCQPYRANVRETTLQHFNKAKLSRASVSLRLTRRSLYTHVEGVVCLASSPRRLLGLLSLHLIRKHAGAHFLP